MRSSIILTILLGKAICDSIPEDLQADSIINI